jgi:hypothetical protein
MKGLKRGRDEDVDMVGDDLVIEEESKRLRS